MHIQLLHEVVGVNSGLHAGAGGGLHHLGYEFLVILQKCKCKPEMTTDSSINNLNSVLTKY